jgi:hypothetical protein
MSFSFLKNNKTNEFEKLKAITKVNRYKSTEIHIQQQKLFDKNYDTLIEEINKHLDSTFPTYGDIKEVAKKTNKYIIFRYNLYFNVTAKFDNRPNKYDTCDPYIIIGENKYHYVNSNIKKGIRLNKENQYEISVKYIINYLGNKKIEGLDKPKKRSIQFGDRVKLMYKW